MRNYGVRYESDIDASLAQFSLTCEDIDIVLMTHMHFDHATGLTDANGQAQFLMRGTMFNKMNGMNLLHLILEVKRRIGL